MTDFTFPDALRTAEAMPVAPDALPEDAAPQHDPKLRPKARSKRRPMPRRNRRGIFGVLLSLVIVVVIIIGIFSVFNQVQTTATATQTAIFVRQLAPQITQRYRGDYTVFSGTAGARAVIGSGFVPSTWQNSPTTIEDPEGREVTINSVDSDGSFTITFTPGVSEEICKAVLGALKSDNTFEKAIVNSAPIDDSELAMAAKIEAVCATPEPSGGGDFVLQFR